VSGTRLGPRPGGARPTLAGGGGPGRPQGAKLVLVTAPWVSGIVRWPAHAGLGLARSVILLVASVLYPAPLALVAWVAWLTLTRDGRSGAYAVPNTLFLGCACVVMLSGPACGLLRLLVRRWTGITVADRYRPAAPIVRTPDGFWNGRRYLRSLTVARANQRVHRQLRDPAAWRERLALMAAPFAVGLVAARPVMSIAVGISTLTLTRSSARLGAFPLRLIGLLPLVLGIAMAPYAWRTAVRVLIWMLRPSPAAALSQRVARLTEQRDGATAAQAAEIRRIERDLHDGAQARLVALGLALTTAERTVDRDPGQAKALLREATATATAALRELRELVRGITPPVLAERGLTDALRALALDIPLPVSVEAGPGLDGRLDAPVESALYFGTAELLTNTVKHARASRVTIRLSPQPGNLVIEVTDDGCGNATLAAAGGLAGLARRLALFDGTLFLDSPAGGPTHATMTVPWTSS
jgi:signal transduction histidine kinase